MAGLQAAPLICDKPPPTVQAKREEEKEELVVYHSESIYNSNEGERGKTSSLAEDKQSSI